MKIAHFALAAILSLGAAVVSAEPASAMVRSAAPVLAAENGNVVQVRHRHYRHYRHYDRHGWRHHRHWRAERRWRDNRYWRHHDRYYRDRYYRHSGNGIYLRLRF